jgi:hypothetical protein
MIKKDKAFKVIVVLFSLEDANTLLRKITFRLSQYKMLCFVFTQNHDNILYFLKNFAIFSNLLNYAYFVWQHYYRLHYQLLKKLSVIKIVISIMSASLKDSRTHYISIPPFQFKAFFIPKIYFF